MATLLYLEASPRKQRSHSIAVANSFLEAYRSAHPGDSIRTIDLWDDPLPSFDGNTIDAKYAVMHRAEPTPGQQAAWAEITRIADDFKAADKYLFSLPMWNFGIPYVLKHFIDVIVQPGLTFNVTPQGQYQGLVTGRPAVLVCARGGAYGPGSNAEAMDNQTTYMKTILKFIGFENIETVLVEPTVAGRDRLDQIRQQATDRARRLAESL